MHLMFPTIRILPKYKKIPATIIVQPRSQQFGILPSRKNKQETLRSWIKPIIENLREGIIPKEERSEKEFKIRVSHFVMIQWRLYKKSIADPYLRCLENHKATKFLKDIHGGDCANHIGGRSLCSNILRTGYYWTTMKNDAFLHAKNVILVKDIVTSFIRRQNLYTLSSPPNHSLNREGIQLENYQRLMVEGS